MFRMTAIAAHPHEAVLKPPVPEVVLNSCSTYPRQFTTLVHQMDLERRFLNPTRVEGNQAGVSTLTIGG